jgi:hypothetical protein
MLKSNYHFADFTDEILVQSIIIIFKKANDAAKVRNATKADQAQLNDLLMTMAKSKHDINTLFSDRGKEIFTNENKLLLGMVLPNIGVESPHDHR